MAQHDTEPVVIGKCYDFVLWLLNKVKGYPREHRFTIGERLASGGLDLLSALVEAAYTREKAVPLELAARKVNMVRLLLRMSKDLKLISIEAYGFSAESLDELGRMVGGWNKKAAKK